MAKNLTTFMPGSKKATTDIEYHSMVMMGAWGEDRNGEANSNYGQSLYYMNRDETACLGNMDKANTSIVLFGGGGQGGAACCCQGSSSGRTGSTAKYSPRWSSSAADSDLIFMCINTACGCCKPGCAGDRGFYAKFCHTRGLGGTNVNRVCACGGCGGAGVCNYFNGNCCNYAMIISSGGRDKTICAHSEQQAGAECYTTCSEVALSSCDAGFDCVYCVSPQYYGYESGSCINRENAGMCGTNMWSNYSNYRRSAFRNGVVEFSTGTVSQYANGGEHMNHMACNFGQRTNKTGYLTVGVSAGGAGACGGACCCGGPGTASMAIIRYKET